MLRGNLAELLVKLDPRLYQKYVIKSKQGVPILYVKPNKAIYGMLRSTMLFKIISESIRRKLVLK